MRAPRFVFGALCFVLLVVPATASAAMITVFVESPIDPVLSVTSQSDIVSSLPSALVHDLTLANADVARIFVETGTAVGGSVFSGPSSGVTLDDGALQALLFPLEIVLAGGDTRSLLSAFTINVAALTTPGVYTKTYQILGGETDEDQNLIGQVNFQVEVTSTQPTPVPEPATLSLLGLGLAGVAARRRMKRR